MLRIAMNRIAISSSVIQAPRVNFVRSTIASTRDVRPRPNALTARERTMVARARGSTSVRSADVQCRTMPSWLITKLMNTPTM